MDRNKIATSLFLTVFLTSCAGRVWSPGEGAFGGAAIGAGTGALVGSIINNGDIAKSALLGGAIGVPVGFAATYVAASMQTTTQERDYTDEIRENQERIYYRQKDIDALREEITVDSQREDTADLPSESLYTGPTLGNPYR